MCLHIVCRNYNKMGKQGKWEAIVDLEVQDLKEKVVFSSKDLVWIEIYQENHSINRVALVPSRRVADFIRGEETNPNAPCTFLRRQNKQPGERNSAALLYEL